MSNLLARLMEPTGLEFHETAYEIDKEIWNFIKHELKRKTKEDEGRLPVRYWQTHAAPLHEECWSMIREITQAMSIYPTDEDQLKTQKAHYQKAIGHNETLLQLIRLLHVELPQIDMSKLNRACELIIMESKYLRGVMNKASVRTHKEKQK